MKTFKKVTSRRITTVTTSEELSNKLHSIETDYSEMGLASEYENPADRFTIWAVADFTLDGVDYRKPIVFDCGLRGDVPIWDGNPSEFDDLSEEQNEFLKGILKEAARELIALRKTLTAND